MIRKYPKTVWSQRQIEQYLLRKPWYVYNNQNISTGSFRVLTWCKLHEDQMGKLHTLIDSC